MDGFLILGGDHRLRYTAQYLAQRGHKVLTALSDNIDDVENIERALDAVENVVLPLPAFQDGVFLTAPLTEARLSAKRLVYGLHPGQRVFGGQLSSYFTETLRPHGVEVYDYYQREEFTVANAVPTAEGALSIALRELPVTVRDLPTLVVGYGHVGKVCARLFRDVGARVTVAARKSADLAWARSEGLEGLKLSGMAGRMEAFGLILNTVPARVLGENLLEQTDSRCLLIELASKPWGIDFEAAERLRRNVIRAPGLPGKQAPETAGQAIGTTILTILKEIGEYHE